MSKLNPKARKLEVGSRILEEITVYPLSLADQFKMTDAIVDAMHTFDSMNGKSDSDVVEAGIGSIKKHLSTIMSLVLDPDSKTKPEDLTNDQVYELAVIIFEVNYEDMLGNYQSLKTRVLGLFKSKKEAETVPPVPAEEVADTQ